MKTTEPKTTLREWHTWADDLARKAGFEILTLGVIGCHDYASYYMLGGVCVQWDGAGFVYKRDWLAFYPSGATRRYKTLEAALDTTRKVLGCK